MPATLSYFVFFFKCNIYYLFQATESVSAFGFAQKDIVNFDLDEGSEFNSDGDDNEISEHEIEQK